MGVGVTCSSDVCVGGCVGVWPALCSCCAPVLVQGMHVCGWVWVCGRVDVWVCVSGSDYFVHSRRTSVCVQPMRLCATDACVCMGVYGGGGV